MHGRAALSMRVNKTDRNDARCLAEPGAYFAKTGQLFR
jgi:hypothetical protein